MTTELKIENLGEGRHRIDLGNDNEIEITVDEDGVGIEIRNLKVLPPNSATVAELFVDSDTLKGD